MSNVIPVTAMATTSQAEFQLVVNPARIQQQIQNKTAINAFIKQALVDKVDYGLIPGVEKKMLFQTGAQKINSLCNVYADVDRNMTDLGDGHREYDITVTLRHMGTNNTVAVGCGSCSTMETKYRYRRGQGEDTGKPAPRGYFDLKKKEPAKALEAIGGKGFTVNKNAEGKWTIHALGNAKVENTDPADQYNTVLKMAIKRATVAATLNMCGGWSEDFDQDADPDPRENSDAAFFEQNPPDPSADQQMDAWLALYKKPAEERRDIYTGWSKPLQEKAQAAAHAYQTEDGLNETEAWAKAFADVAITL